MAKNTFQGLLRSSGGDNSKTAYPGSVTLNAPFYFDPTAANTTEVQRSASDTRGVVLPVNAAIMGVTMNAAGTGGTNPTFDMGWIGYSDATALNVDGIIAEGDADVGASVYNYATATAGTEMGNVMSSTQMVKITGGVGASAATGGAIGGTIHYFVSDDGTYDT